MEWSLTAALGGVVVLVGTGVFVSVSMVHSTSGAAKRSVAAPLPIERRSAPVVASRTLIPTEPVILNQPAIPTQAPTGLEEAGPVVQKPAIEAAEKPLLNPAPAVEAPLNPAKKPNPVSSAVEPAPPEPSRARIAISAPHRPQHPNRRYARVRHKQPATIVSSVAARPDFSHEESSGSYPQQPASRQTSEAPRNSALVGFDVVSEARRWLGTNPTGLSSLWCARFMNFVLERTGYRSSGSDLARSFSTYGQRIAGPRVGAIAVMSRGRSGGHVGVVSGVDAKGNPIIISGNYSKRVAETAFPRGRIYAYVMP